MADLSLAQAFEQLASDFLSLTTLVRQLLYTNAELSDSVAPLKQELLAISERYSKATEELNSSVEMVEKFRTNVTALTEELTQATPAEGEPQVPIEPLPPVEPPIGGGDEIVPPVVEPPVVPPSIPE